MSSFVVPQLLPQLSGGEPSEHSSLDDLPRETHRRTVAAAASKVDSSQCTAYVISGFAYWNDIERGAVPNVRILFRRQPVQAVRINEGVEGNMIMMDTSQRGIARDHLSDKATF